MLDESHAEIRRFSMVCLFIVSVILFGSTSCRDRRTSIAVIPRTTATPIWEAEHLGVQVVARHNNVRIYWNAPTREDDVESQITIIERVMKEGYEGLILAPDNASSLVAPVRRVLDRGVPVVVIGSPLVVQSSENLCYLLNDENNGGQLAAERLSRVLRGHGTVALLGVNRDVLGIVYRTRAFASALPKDSPNIRIVDVRLGTFDEDHERQVATDLLIHNHNLDAIVTLSSASTHGLLEAMAETDIDTSHMKVIAFDRDDDDRLLFDTPNIDSIVMENTERMGAEAVRQIVGKLNGHPICSTQLFKPALVTRENLHQQMESFRSMLSEVPPGERWRWMVNR